MHPIRLSILAAAISIAGAAVAQTAVPLSQPAPAPQAAPGAATPPAAGAPFGRGPDCDRDPPKRHAHHRPNPDWFFGRVQRDRDGQVSREDLIAAQQRRLQMFDRADANRDGKVSREEMHAMRDALREQHRQRRQDAAPVSSGAPAPAPASEADHKG
jgi:hypothetical protein